MTENAQNAWHPLTTIKLRGHRKRRIAQAILQKYPIKLSDPTASSRDVIKVVCISDTHNHQPELPAGDILIHAGDLTDNGSFEEVQAGLRWFSSQPHRCKIVAAGNHDVLLDEDFLKKYPERRYGDTRTKEDLVWGDVIYLQDSHVTLEFPSRKESNLDAAVESSGTTRKLTIYGSPWTPQYGISCFQYPPTNESHWSDRIGSLKPDILITHGPPKLYRDKRDFYQAGCAFLTEQVARVKPRLVVFGHIHAAYGREDVVLDDMRWAHDRVVMGWAGWGALVWMGVLLVWGYVRTVCGVGLGVGRSGLRRTTFVNASVVAGRGNELGNELRNAPIVVEI